MKTDAVIAVAGWEERFEKGLRSDLESYSPSKAIVFVFNEHQRETKRQRTAVSEFARAKGIEYLEVPVTRDPAQLWSTIRRTFSSREWSSGSALVDLTTMPREVIWWTFSFLRSSQADISYIYHRPEEYALDWLTRDTDQPRLVYQHSGISAFGKKTCLLLLTGFDVDRAAQMIQFFEPRVVLIGLQRGSQYNNQVKNVEQSRQMLGRKPEARFFELDAYSSDHGQEEIENAVGKELEHFNIIAASLGPKISAVSLYQLQCKHPEIALAYAPSRQFNPNYSAGIADSIADTLVCRSSE
jgi:hypothetical protein